MSGPIVETLAEALALAVGGLALYAGLVWLASEYSRRTGWQSPEGSQHSAWALRRQVGAALGGLALVICAICCVAFLGSWPARLLVMAQAALMASAGASDLHRFHLPLPFTLAGIGLALVLAIATGRAPLVWLFALLWACGVIVLHTLASKGSMQLGDHIATAWIALAAPFNGLLAIIAGDLANVAVARAQGLRGKKVAAAGAWLVVAAGVIALPPYVAWFTGQAQAPAESGLAVDARRTAAQAETPGADLLADLADQAAEQTARIALADQRADRILAAQQAAGRVRQLAASARQIAPGSTVVIALDDLSVALGAYDVDGVRAASLRLAEAREGLSQFTPTEE